MTRILVVDDEQDLCEILRFNLESEGYEVTTANSAEEALSKFEIRNSKFNVESEGTSGRDGLDPLGCAARDARVAPTSISVSHR